MPPTVYPPSSKVWIAVRGAGDTCIRRAESTTQSVLAWRSQDSARCRHVLRALGSLGEYSIWDEPERAAPLAARLLAVAHNDTYYPSICKRAGVFEIVYTLWDKEGGLIEDMDAQARLSVMDSTGAHLLFQSACERTFMANGIQTCAIRGFCPTVDVLLRVSVSGVSGSVRVAAGHGLECPPPPGWALALTVDEASKPFFPGELLRVRVQMLKSPGHLLAYHLALEVVQPRFAFVSFEGIGQCEHKQEDGRLTLHGDLSLVSTEQDHLLGWLVFRVDAADFSGLAQMVKIHFAEFMLIQGGWLFVPVLGGGFVCGKDLRVLVDHRRPTGVIARASKSTLIFWQGVQATAGVFPAEIQSWAVWNTGEPPSALTECTCSSPSRSVLRVVSCTRIEPVGRGQGVVWVRCGPVSTTVLIHVLRPKVMGARFFPDDTGRRGRVEVQATLAGAVLDIAPFVLDKVPPGVTLIQGDELQCLSGFEGRFTLGNPVLFDGLCPQAGPDQPELHLLSGTWTRRGDFRLAPSSLLSSIHANGVHILGADRVVSNDPTRAVVSQDGKLHLVRDGQSPRNVMLLSGGWAWSVQVVPPAPSRLQVAMSATVLVVQQDVWGLVPDVSRLVMAALFFSDGSSVDVTDDPRLTCTALGLGLKLQRHCVVETFTQAGTASIVFSMRGLECVTTSVQLTVFASSVVNATLTCPQCPSVISARDDPLGSRQGLAASIPLAAFVVRRLLVDGRVDDSSEAQLQVEGDGVLDTAHVLGLRGGEILITSPHSQGRIRVQVLARWATGYRLMCNGMPCNGIKLAAPGDGASLDLFAYSSRLELAVELLLINGTALVLHADSLPQASILVNGTQTGLVLVPGDVEIKVVFLPVWNFAELESAVTLHVATLVSLEVRAPTVIRQLHCSRIWERHLLHVLGRLSDGYEAELLEQHFHASGVFRVTSSGLLFSVWAGEGTVNTTFAGLSAQVSVTATLDSRLFTGVDLHIPELFNAGLGDQLSVQAALIPFDATPAVVKRAMRWVVSEQGVFDADGMTLLSDFHSPVKISAIIRTCQGVDPIVEERSVQVNVVPNVRGQVDFGAMTGPPLPHVLIGETLEVPIFVFAPTPLVGFYATVSLPGLHSLECAVGELPFSECLVHDGTHVTLSGSYPASQRTGRLYLGGIRGQVVLNAFSRLRVTLHKAELGEVLGNTTFEFTVKLGQPSPNSADFRPRLNSVTPFALEPLILPPHDRPVRIQACCGVVLASPGTILIGLLPKSFQLRRVWLEFADDSKVDVSPDDLRLEFQFDGQLLKHGPTAGVWQAEAGAVGVTEIRLVYTEPSTQRQLSASVDVIFAWPQSLELIPQSLELRRLHCVASRFQSRQMQARLHLADGAGSLNLKSESLSNFVSTDMLVLSAESGSLRVEGRRVGEASVELQAYGLSARSGIVVRDDSVLLRELVLEDPYTLSAARGSVHALRIHAVWEDGARNPAVLRPVIQADGPVTPVDDLALIAHGNTHPASTHWLRVTVPACQNGSMISARSQLVIRLLPNLTHFRPVDLLVSADRLSLNVSLAVAVDVSAFFVRLYTDIPLVSWSPGADMPGLADCVLQSGGTLLLLAGAGLMQAANRSFLLLQDVHPMPFSLWGDVEIYDGTFTVNVPISAGQFGTVVNTVPAETQRPVVDAGTLARQYQAGDPALMSSLRLLTERERLVDVRAYSNEHELSVMLRIVDRFLRPDTSANPVVILTHDGSVVTRQQASHVVDGWYAYQFMGDVPRRTLHISFELFSRRTEVEDPLVTGRALRVCPRVAMDRASFQLVYHLHVHPPDNLAARVACQAHVAQRRVLVQARADGVFTLAVAVESFIRIHQVHEAIMNDLVWPRNSSSMRRLVQDDAWLTRTGLVYINDTADRLVPCPPGTYFSVNGTYERLPLHALAGPDCYGMVCADGYTLLVGGSECAPAVLGLDVVWVCVSVILGLIGFVSCVLCLLHLGKLRAAHQEDPTVACMPEASWPTESQHSTDPFLDDDPEFRNILTETYLDDYAKTLLDDEFSVIPMEPVRG